MSMRAANESDVAAGDAAAEAGRAETGILPCQALEALIRDGAVDPGEPLAAGQVQPASMDLRLGATAYRVRASFLPGRGNAVDDKIERFTMHAIDLTDGAVLERGCVYIVPLLESLDLPDRLSGLANPKSSTGRLDVFTRLITDNATSFDKVEAGYSGPLFIEIAPRTFSILVRKGARLNQLRLRRGQHVYSDAEVRRLHERSPLVQAGPGEAQIVAGGIGVTVDLEGPGGDGIIGYKARQHTPLIDLNRIAHYDAAEFWEPIRPRRGEGLILNPDDFYILASREAVTVPPDHAAEMVAYDTLVGEFRVHYAGFFDPGFGWGEAGEGTRAVLEVRSHDVPFLLEHGQLVGRLVYERLTDKPDRLYGQDIGSNYQRQGLKLAKQFRL